MLGNRADVQGLFANSIYKANTLNVRIQPSFQKAWMKFPKLETAELKTSVIYLNFNDSHVIDPFSLKT